MTREIMAKNRGTRYAQRILEHEHATVFSQPPDCERCGMQVEIFRSHGKRNYQWWWVCPADREKHPRRLIFGTGRTARGPKGKGRVRSGAKR